MKIGLLDVDSHNFPNLAMMKISAWHKAKGDTVEWWFPLECYDIVYVSKVFGDEYSTMDTTIIRADKIIYGGTGFAMSVVDGKEVYEKANDGELPPEIEHSFPDYALFPDLTKDTAFGFLTRGCPNNCGFCCVTQKEGKVSHKVADLAEFWSGQKHIKLLDANILACRQQLDLLQQLVDSKASVDFTQGLDARFVNKDNLELLRQMKIKMVHFAFDFMKNEKQIIKGLQTFVDIVKPSNRKGSVYVLTNFDTTFDEDIYRIKKIQSIGLTPDVRIYRKASLPKRHILRDLQRWCNNRFIYRSCPDFMDYIPRKDGLTIRQLYFKQDGETR